MTAAPPDAHAKLAQLVQTHQAGLWRYVRYLGARVSEADDLVQETFLALFRDRFEVRSPGETVGYLRTVARRRLLMLRRRQRREIATVELEAAENVWARMTGDNGAGDLGAGVLGEGDLGEGDLLDALQDCLAKAVNPRMRRALDLHYRDAASRVEIGQALDLSVEGVKTLLRRARSALRDCLARKRQGP